VTQHGCLPSLLGDGDKEIEILYGEEKILCTGPTTAAKAQQKTLVTERQDKIMQPRKYPFHLYSLSSHSAQFQQSTGATTLFPFFGWAIFTKSVLC
jgi:hypothetical protein